MLQARLWLPPWGTESWPARTPWVLGFFSGRGKPLVLWGGTGARPLEKRERGLPELLTVLAGQPWKRTTCLTLAWFLAPALGVPFFLGQNLREGQWSPRTEASTVRGHQKVWCAPRRKGTLPFHGAWLTGAKCSRRPTVEKEGKQEKAN